MAIQIPFADQSVSTDPKEGAEDFGRLALGVMLLAAATGVGLWAFNRVRDLAGVSDEVSVPGV